MSPSTSSASGQHTKALIVPFDPLPFSEVLRLLFGGVVAAHVGAGALTWLFVSQGIMTYSYAEGAFPYLVMFLTPWCFFGAAAVFMTNLEQREKDYEQLLRGVELAELIRASESPGLDEPSRRRITAYLNQTYPNKVYPTHSDGSP